MILVQYHGLKNTTAVYHSIYVKPKGLWDKKNTTLKPNKNRTVLVFGPTQNGATDRKDLLGTVRKVPKKY